MKQQFIDTTLTPDNCEEKGYEFITDIFYNPDETSSSSERAEIDKELHEGGKLGKPEQAMDNNDPHAKFLYGFYLPLSEELKLLRSITPDHTLTPSNAKLKGYKFMDEIYFDPEAGVDANQEVIKYVKQGYQLGLLSDDSGAENYFGLYRPLN